jgi:hypothetical protein
MKLWVLKTRIPDDEDQYVVIGLPEEYISDMLKLIKININSPIQDTRYSIPAGPVDYYMYPCNPATDALFDDPDYEREYEVACSIQSDSFKSLHNALTLAGVDASAYDDYDTYVHRIDLLPDGRVEILVNIQLNEECGWERVVYFMFSLVHEDERIWSNTTDEHQILMAL